MTKTMTNVNTIEREVEALVLSLANATNINLTDDEKAVLSEWFDVENTSEMHFCRNSNTDFSNLIALRVIYGALFLGENWLITASTTKYASSFFKTHITRALKSNSGIMENVRKCRNTDGKCLIELESLSLEDIPSYPVNARITASSHDNARGITGIDGVVVLEPSTFNSDTKNVVTAVVATSPRPVVIVEDVPTPVDITVD